ncbi:MAG: ATP-binding cassette domain-containing protein [Deltaproteobacteria bacterium]|nr:ATP-binding cassette domain-containing protein [Deltaproteobacteria bacterium]
MTSAIEFKDVTKTFAKKDGTVQTVLDRVSFSIPAGKTTVIAGGSGSGKSVTLKIVLGLMRANSGRVLVQGNDVTGAKGKELETLRTQFGVLFQGSALFDSLTVFENVALPLRERTKKTEEEIGSQVHASLSQFELDGHEDKYPAQLSGSMKKRVGLARAMQLKPAIMLFDEPTTGLDPVKSYDVYRLVFATQKRLGYTSVIVSHDIPKIFNLADKIAILHQGKVRAYMAPDELQRSRDPFVREFIVRVMGVAYNSNKNIG